MHRVSFTDRERLSEKGGDDGTGRNGSKNR
jgi:hypothetical protein